MNTNQQNNTNPPTHTPPLTTGTIRFNSMQSFITGISSRHIGSTNHDPIPNTYFTPHGFTNGLPHIGGWEESELTRLDTKVTLIANWIAGTPQERTHIEHIFQAQPNALHNYHQYLTNNNRPHDADLIAPWIGKPRNYPKPPRPQPPTPQPQQPKGFLHWLLHH